MIWVLFVCTWVGGMAAGATLQGILDDRDDRKRVDREVR